MSRLFSLCLVVCLLAVSVAARPEALHDDSEAAPDVAPLSMAEVAAHADADWSHHVSHLQHKHVSLSGLHALHRQAVADAFDSEPCYPKPCVGARLRRRSNIAASVVQVPYPVPVYVNKVRVVKVRTPNKHGRLNPHTLLKVEKPPSYASEQRNYKSSQIEADKRALLSLTTRIANRRRLLDRHDHWILDAARAVDVVEKEIKNTESTKQLLDTQLTKLNEMRERWTNKLKADELKYDIENARRSLLEIKAKQNEALAQSEDGVNPALIERTDAAEQALQSLQAAHDQHVQEHAELDAEEIENY